ncbi:hypothetical protein KAR91_68270 [Candidatus Pacearchaeota archaeon]|nr:hypothetical protein [Candidatus Pacearchaeota archaeon]
MKRFLIFIQRFRLFKRLAELEAKNKQLTIKQALDISYHETFVRTRMAKLKEFTRVDADVGVRGNNTIILTGVFRNKAYVKFYDMGDGEFKRLALQLQDMRKYSLIRHIDKPMAFSGTFDIDRF